MGFRKKGQGRQQSGVDGVYKYRDTRQNCAAFVTIAELKVYSETLPAIAKAAVESGCSLTQAQNKALMLLLDFSTQIWGGDHKGVLTEVSADDYRTEYYITMVKYLKKFDRSKGCWVSQCRFAGFDTRAKFMRSILGHKKERRLAADLLVFDEILAEAAGVTDPFASYALL